jgi:hypothetical protein
VPSCGGGSLVETAVFPAVCHAVKLPVSKPPFLSGWANAEPPKKNARENDNANQASFLVMFPLPVLEKSKAATRKSNRNRIAILPATYWPGKRLVKTAYNFGTMSSVKPEVTS